MAELHTSLATLRIKGDELLPHEITEMLGCEPTFSHKKGQIRIGKKTGHRSKSKSGGWMLEAEDATPGNIDAQVNEILGKLPNDMKVWRIISSKYDLDLFCGFMMKETDEGLEISAKTLHELGTRGIKLELCLYAPLREIST